MHCCIEGKSRSGDGEGQQGPHSYLQGRWRKRLQGADGAEVKIFEEVKKERLRF